MRPAAPEFDANAFVSTTGKGKPVAAIVEGVMNGGMIRVTLLPDLVPAAVSV